MNLEPAAGGVRDVAAERSLRDEKQAPAGPDASAAGLGHVVLGAFLGVCGWAALRVLLPSLPNLLRFVVTFGLFTCGPGAALASRITRGLDRLVRLIVLIAAGTAAAPVLIDLLGRFNLLPAFPFVAAALAGGALATWRPGAQRRTAAPASRSDLAACLLIVAVALGTGAVAFAHRLAIGPEHIQIYGDYDSFDLTFYAAWASEATHTVPPTASYYAGHGLNAAYYPHLILAMVHRFGLVPMLPIYFGYAWPAFLAAGALMLFVLTRSLASSKAALVAALLTLLCGDFSYLAAWFLPHSPAGWDYLLWPTNFFDPTMEVLHFNNWTPSLPVFYLVLYAVVRGLQTANRRWLAAAALLLPVLFEFKPFAYAIVLAALIASTLFARGDRTARRSTAATAALGVLFTLPFLAALATLGGDRRSRLLIDYFVLPRRMLLKLDVANGFANLVDRLMPIAVLRTPLVLLAATTVFFAVGLGIRWAGVPGVWRGVTGRVRADTAAWRVLAWTAVAGVAVPFVVATDPYVDTLQFYQAGLYVLWIFTATTLMSLTFRPFIRIAVVTLAIAASVPSSIHYLAMKWTDDRRPPVAALNRDEIVVADFLRTTDPTTTVFLDDDPTVPSLVAILAERRTVLAWGRTYYAVGSATRAREVNRFFQSAARTPEVAIDVLRRHHVTHVIVRADRDHVHSGALAQLKPLLQLPTLTLYGVPSGLGS